MPLCNKYKDRDVKTNINIEIIVNENEIDTSLIPNIPSLKVFTTYNIGFAIDTCLHNSGNILME
jgi:hypothetical protein